MKKSFIACFLAFCLVFGLTVVNVAKAAPFTNGDFETGFTGWGGDLVVTGMVAPGTDSHFNIVNSPQNVAKIENDDNDWIATLYQDFDMEALAAPGNTLDLSFWIQWIPTDSTMDGLDATIDNGTDTIDLLASISDSDLLSGTTVTSDVTDFAGQSVELAFSLWDADWLTPDSLKIDDVTFAQSGAAPVPEPTTLFLVATGLVGLAGLKRKNRE